MDGGLSIALKESQGIHAKSGDLPGFQPYRVVERQSISATYIICDRTGELRFPLSHMRWPLTFR
jgi:hypothetical protein